MKGNEIFLTTPSIARRWEGTAGAAMYPGTCVEVQAGTAPVNGRFTFVPYCATVGADGDPRVMLILDFDWAEGFTALSQIAIGQRCFARFPLPGEEVNILLAGQQGTGSANAFTIGERLIAQHATGLFIQESTSSIGSPFMCLEHIDEVPNVATLAWCLRT